MKKRFLSMLAMLLMAAAGAWADTTVTWTTSDMSSGLFVDFFDGTVINNVIKGITATGSTGGGGSWSGNDIASGNGDNTITFTSSVGNIKSIEIKADQINISSNPPGGWTISDAYQKLSWSGEASSTVSLTFSSGGSISSISEIVFTIAPTGYNITLDEGTGNKDSQNWEITPQSSELGGGEAVTVKYNGSREVKSVTVVKVAKGGAVDNTYMKWDADQKKLVATPMPATYNTVENANDFVDWSAGTYVVEGDVTINGTIRLKGNVDLIIKDGAKLTVNSYINGDFNNLSIYGQAQKTGQLVVLCSDFQAISDLSTLEVHSAEVTATASGNDKRGGISIDKFNVYGGLVDAKSTAADGGYGISLSGGGSMDIYGGEVKAEGKGTGDWDCGIVCGSFSGATVTVHGGKLWAENAEKKALNYIDLKKGDGFTGKIETSNDNEFWDELPIGAIPADEKYVRVGY